MYEERNTGTKVPAQIEIEAVQGDRLDLLSLSLVKGENVRFGLCPKQEFKFAAIARHRFAAPADMPVSDPHLTSKEQASLSSTPPRSSRFQVHRNLCKFRA